MTNDTTRSPVGGQSPERIYEGEVVEGAPEWEALVSEWTEGARLEFAGQIRQARAAATVARCYGRASIEAFAKEVGCAKTKVYDYARVWWVYAHIFEGGEISGRPETLSITHYIEASYAEDPQKMLEEAEDEGLSTRAIKERRREQEEPENVEVVETRVCPMCGGNGEVPA